MKNFKLCALSALFCSLALTTTACTCSNQTQATVETKASLTSKDFKTADEVIEYLKKGNQEYVVSNFNNGNISAEQITNLYQNGQKPYAVVITCGDSRVVPEHIFMTGLGELFTIRVAGNVTGDMEIASAVYGAEHLGTKLIVVLGHTNCGAVASAMSCKADDEQTSLTPLLSAVKQGMGDETDPSKASLNNANSQVQRLLAVPELKHLAEHEGLKIVTAIYNTDTGVVDFY